MGDALTTAAHSLHVALEQYISVCSAILSCYTRADQVSGSRQLLSDRVVKELQSFGTYEAKLRQARAKLSLGRNCSTTIVPINILPDEILAQVFQLVYHSQLCAGRHRGDDELASPKYPDLFSHVCSRWRHVAISSRSLWSHIDLSPCHLRGKRLLDRAKVFAARAGGSSLYIHVTHLNYRGVRFEETKLEHEEFLGTIATRTGSLELLLGDFVEDSDAENSDTGDPDTGDSDAGDSDTEDLTTGSPMRGPNVSILAGWLGRCIPGTLTQLIITRKSYQTPNHLESALVANREGPGSILINLPRDFLEDLWQSITVLRFHGVCPYWTSKAYHNLVELRLTSHPLISETQLVGMLRSSPMLRVLHLSLAITESEPSNALITPVFLDKLEVLSLSSTPFLQWVVPGSLPLRLSITNHVLSKTWLNAGLKMFSERSNIVSLRLVLPTVTYRDVPGLFGLFPYLQTLVLDGEYWRPSVRYRRRPVEPPESRPENHADILAKPVKSAHLYLFRYPSIDLDAFGRSMARSGLVQVLTLWRCNFAQNGQERICDADSLQRHLSNVCPVVEVVDRHKPSPIGDWD